MTKKLGMYVECCWIHNVYYKHFSEQLLTSSASNIVFVPNVGLRCPSISRSLQRTIKYTAWRNANRNASRNPLHHQQHPAVFTLIIIQFGSRGMINITVISVEETTAPAASSYLPVFLVCYFKKNPGAWKLIIRKHAVQRTHRSENN